MKTKRLILIAAAIAFTGSLIAQTTTTRIYYSYPTTHYAVTYWNGNGYYNNQSWYYNNGYLGNNYHPNHCNNHYYHHGNVHHNHCNRYAMRPADFQAAKQAIRQQTFSREKVILAKQIISANYMTSEQVRQMLHLFTFGQAKLKVAEFAYARTVDPQNFYRVNDAFTFSSYVDKLDNYIRNYRM